MACGEGYGSAVLAEHAAEVTGVDANPEAHEHARLRYGRPGLRFERGLVEEWDEGAPWDAIVFLQTIEHVTDPAAMLRRFAGLLAPDGVAYVSTPNRLTLAPPGAERSDNPVARARVHAPRNTATSSPRRSAASSSWACSMRASCAHTSWRCGWAGTARTRDCASRGRSTPASCRRSASATSSCAAGRSSARWTCWRCAGRDGGPRPGRAVHPAPLPHALRGGLRHVAVRRGMAAGGDGVPRTCRCSRCSSVTPGRERAGNRHRRRHAGAGGPARAAGRRGALPGVHARHPQRVPQRGRAPGSSATGQHDAAAALRLSAGDYERAAEDFERRGGDILGALRALRDGGAIDLWASCATHAVLPLLATDSGVRMQVEAGVAAHRQRFGSWSGGFWLPECAYRPGVEDHLARAGVRGFLRRPDRWRPIRSTTSSRSPRAGRSPCRSTGARFRWCGTTAATRRTRSIGTTTRRRSTACGPGRTAAGPTTATPPTPGRVSMPRTSWSR